MKILDWIKFPQEKEGEEYNHFLRRRVLWGAVCLFLLWIITAGVPFIFSHNSSGGVASDYHYGVLIALIAMLIVFVYFLPAVTARGKSQAQQVFWLNLLLGWTIIGWVVAFVWAQGPGCSSPAREDAIAQALPPDPVKTCPYCAETIKAAAKICRYCNREV